MKKSFTSATGKIELISGNALKFLQPRHPEYDLLLSSPPFIAAEVFPSISEGQYYDWFKSLLYNALDCCRIVIMFNSSKRLVDICQKFRPDKVMIWNKQVGMGAFRFEPIFIWAHPGEKLNGIGRIWSDLLSFHPIPAKKQACQYQNPVGLYLQLLRYFPKHTNVLEPFGGSGTTAIAAATKYQRNTERNVTIIEADKKKFALASKRIQHFITKGKDIYGQ